MKYLLMFLTISLVSCGKDDSLPLINEKDSSTAPKIDCEDCERVLSLEEDITALKKAYIDFSKMKEGDSFSAIKEKHSYVFQKYGVNNGEDGLWTFEILFLHKDGKKRTSENLEAFEEGYCPGLFGIQFYNDEDKIKKYYHEGDPFNTCRKYDLIPIMESAYLERAFTWAREHK